MPVLTQQDIDEFLSTTVYGLLKNDKTVTPQFIQRQKELCNLLQQDRHLITIKSSKTKMSLLHAAASNNALLLGKTLVDHVNGIILGYDPFDPDQQKREKEEMDIREQRRALEKEEEEKFQKQENRRRKSVANNPNALANLRPSEMVVVRSKENWDPRGDDFVDLIESEDLSKMTPLMYAAFEGNLPFIDLLCDNGADLLAQDELGQTPLHWAVQGGEHSAIQLLLQWERGAQALCLSDRLGQTPTDIARTYDRRFWHIRNHKSLLEVLAKEYTTIKIPTVGYLHRQELKGRFLSRFGEWKRRIGDIKLASSIPSRSPPRTEFRDIGGGWIP
ncbi:unnamed protein product [Amoebophrya sp. A120]|nr:unnamed protein product [Amoebophrya sp. A120]|eukprot:GSA120T00012419001.1